MKAGAAELPSGLVGRASLDAAGQPHNKLIASQQANCLTGVTDAGGTSMRRGAVENFLFHRDRFPSGIAPVELRADQPEAP
jgi:hypothetical protein